MYSPSGGRGASDERLEDATGAVPDASSTKPATPAPAPGAIDSTQWSSAASLTVPEIGPVSSVPRGESMRAKGSLLSTTTATDRSERWPAASNAIMTTVAAPSGSTEVSQFAASWPSGGTARESRTRTPAAVQSSQLAVRAFASATVAVSRVGPSRAVTHSPGAGSRSSNRGRNRVDRERDGLFGGVRRRVDRADHELVRALGRRERREGPGDVACPARDDRAIERDRPRRRVIVADRPGCGAGRGGPELARRWRREHDSPAPCGLSRRARAPSRSGRRSGRSRPPRRPRRGARAPRPRRWRTSPRRPRARRRPGIPARSPRRARRRASRPRGG